METVICEQQDAYYAALNAADQQTEATLFVEFMLQALQQALLDSSQSDQVTDQVSDQVARLLQVLNGGVALKAGELMQHLQLVHRPTFRNHYLNPALAAGLVEMIDPDSPRSPVQKYRLTAQGARWVASK